MASPPGTSQPLAAIQAVGLRVEAAAFASARSHHPQALDPRVPFPCPSPAPTARSSDTDSGLGGQPAAPWGPPQRRRPLFPAAPLQPWLLPSLGPTPTRSPSPGLTGFQLRDKEDQLTVAPLPPLIPTGDAVHTRSAGSASQEEGTGGFPAGLRAPQDKEGDGEREPCIQWQCPEIT